MLYSLTCVDGVAHLEYLQTQSSSFLSLLPSAKNTDIHIRDTQSLNNRFSVKSATAFNIMLQS
jgi:hypothetical protein